MKKSIFTLILCAVGYFAAGQTTRDAKGNYYTASKQGQQAAKTDSTTVYTYTDAKMKTWPVYEGKNGGRYIWRVSSKTGKGYRQYLPKEVKP